MYYSKEDLEEELEDLLGSVTLKFDAKGKLVIYTNVIDTPDGLINKDHLEETESDSEDESFHIDDDDDYEYEEDDE